jgi:hypothetical protein
MRKYAAASSNASPRRNGHLGTFQLIESFTLPVSGKKAQNAIRFLLD